jgi:DNA-binding response OmpR family regulator
VPRLLIVDSDETQRKNLSIGLRLEGFEVSVASTANDALKRLAAVPTIDLVIVDVMMPGLNGLELSREIRDRFPGVRVVLSGAFHLSRRQLERADCGAIGFVSKPYRVADICSFLRARTQAAAPPVC